MNRTVVTSRSKTSYVVEFLIIITGIMVSFILNEWRESKKIDERKQHLLVDINNDLRIDSITLEQCIFYYGNLVRGHDSLLLDREKIFNEDSLTDYLDFVSSYYPFNETATTYQRIVDDRDITVEKGDSALLFFMNLHNRIYPNYHEWLNIERDFVLKTVLPYMDKNAPFIYPTPPQRSFNGKVFYELRKQDDYMNYLKSGRLYKKMILQYSNVMLNYIKQAKEITNKELAAQKKKK